MEENEDVQFPSMEEYQHVQFPAPRPSASPMVSAAASDPSVQSIGVFREMPIAPPRKITPQRMAPVDYTALAHQLCDMQKQLVGVMELQQATHAHVGDIHAIIKELVAEKMSGSRFGGAPMVVQEPPDNQRVSPLTISGETCSSPRKPSLRSHVANPERNSPRRPSKRSHVDNPDQKSPRRPSVRSHVVLPYQKKLLALSQAFPSQSSGTHSQRNAANVARSRSLDTYGTYIDKPSINIFGNKETSQMDDMNMLLEIFRVSEEGVKDYPAALSQSVRPSSGDGHSVGVMINSLSGALIALNAIFIGIRMDHIDAEHLGWTAIDIGFTAFFLMEIGYRVFIDGVCQHFCGSSRYLNIFDAILVLIDLMQQIVNRALPHQTDTLGLGLSTSLFRIARLGKLARMLHLLRLDIFTVLFTILQGMWGGLHTLGWSMVLCAVAIYIVALLFRELFGSGDVSNVTDMFNTVPRSMLTTFRCSFGDCTSHQGVPVFEYVNDEYGGLAALLYCSYLFMITIGLFNVISAVFVESTMEAASSMQTQKKKERLRDYVLWCTNVAILVKRLVAISRQGGSADGSSKVTWTQAIREMYFLKIPCSAIDDLAQDPEAIGAFSALDIAPEDRDYLSDILDPDNDGTIHIIELIEGLRRLRGDPRRSDIVTVNLMLRSIQRQIAEVFAACKSMKDGQPAGSGPGTAEG